MSQSTTMHGSKNILDIRALNILFPHGIMNNQA